MVHSLIPPRWNDPMVLFAVPGFGLVYNHIYHRLFSAAKHSSLSYAYSYAYQVGYSSIQYLQDVGGTNHD